MRTLAFVVAVGLASLSAPERSFASTASAHAHDAGATGPSVTVDPTSGYAGTAVVVHGRGFATAANRLVFCPPRIVFRDAADNASVIGTFGPEADFDVSAAIPAGAEPGQGTISAVRLRVFYHPPYPPRCLASQSASTAFTVVPGPGLFIGDVTLAEGDSGTAAFEFPVTLSQPAASTVTAHVQTADDTAKAGTDYQALSDTVTFDPGTTQQTVGVFVNGDTDPEPDETFSMTLTSPQNAGIADGSGTGTIENDDPPTLSIDDASAKETDAGTFAMTFGVTLSAPAPAPVTVHFHTVDGTADAPADFRAATGMVTVAQGSLAAGIVVHGVGDLLSEPTEAFTVVLTGPTGATIADATGVGRIIDDGDRCTMVGTIGGDTLVGTVGDDVICGLGGPDTVWGRVGDDLLIGGWGHDSLVAGPGADTLVGGIGADTLRGVDGVPGNDTLRGGDGHDTCTMDPGDHVAGCP